MIRGIAEAVPATFAGGGIGAATGVGTSVASAVAGTAVELPEIINEYKRGNITQTQAAVMVFNYGAGKEAIVAAIVRDLTVDAIEAIAKDRNVMKKLGLADNVLKEKSMEAKALGLVHKYNVIPVRREWKNNHNNDKMG